MEWITTVKKKKKDSERPRIGIQTHSGNNEVVGGGRWNATQWKLRIAGDPRGDLLSCAADNSSVLRLLVLKTSGLAPLCVDFMQRVASYNRSHQPSQQRQQQEDTMNLVYIPVAFVHAQFHHPPLPDPSVSSLTALNSPQSCISGRS